MLNNPMKKFGSSSKQERNQSEIFEKAKSYFKKFGGSHWMMSRAYLDGDRFDYMSLNIPKSLEDEWYRELIKEMSDPLLRKDKIGYKDISKIYELLDVVTRALTPENIETCLSVLEGCEDKTNPEYMKIEIATKLLSMNGFLNRFRAYGDKDKVRGVIDVAERFLHAGRHYAPADYKSGMKYIRKLRYGS